MSYYDNILIFLTVDVGKSAKRYFSGKNGFKSLNMNSPIT